MSNSEKPKFTPGPWHVRQGTKSGFDGGRYFVCHEEHGYIACMSFPDDGDDYDNATLIAAAPDLYEALLEARERMMGGSPAIMALMAKTDAALAKADGRS